MPEGDTLHRAAARLQPLVGHVIRAESVHGRARALGVADAIDGLALERVEALGKNLLFSFEGGLLMRSHLRMSGRWRVQPAGQPILGRPWLVLRAAGLAAVLWNGPLLELARARHDRLAQLGPDVMRAPPDTSAMLARLRATRQGRELGEALLDQRLVAGIGNMWKAEGLFLSRVSPWARLRDVDDRTLEHVLATTARAMREGDRRRRVYGRSGRPCPRCGTPIESWPQGDDARIAYWCPACQPLPETAPARAGRPTRDTSESPSGHVRPREL
ncbi:MAG: hypothetical protein ICV74_01360 [Thermoleophilia bacterium]|nr:hypothetical protein [Thermoleophilia bacterium]